MCNTCSYLFPVIACYYPQCEDICRAIKHSAPLRNVLCSPGQACKFGQACVVKLFKIYRRFVLRICRAAVLAEQAAAKASRQGDSSGEASSGAAATAAAAGLPAEQVEAAMVGTRE